MVVCTRTLVDYAQNLKDTGFNSISLSDESKNKLLDAAKLVYEVAQESIGVEIKIVSEESRKSPPKKVFSMSEGRWIEKSDY